jgi:HD-GYP domain-containing protein (c-di-GMP phosphodiesterase class II)
MSPFKLQSSAELNVDESLFKLAAEIDRFEGYEHPHAARIAILSDEIAKTFNLAPHDRLTLRQAALVHDLGEAIMNRDYINNNSFLNEDERLDLMRHPVIGEQEAAKRGLSRAVQLLVRWHQEWWNGEGYPDGLLREQIPLAARILRVVDTYCALTDNRPHCPAISIIEARKYVIQWAGLEFDPRVVGAFLDLPEEKEELKSFEANQILQSSSRRAIDARS